MKRTLIILLLNLLLAATVLAQNGADLLQKGLRKEQVEGDIKAVPATDKDGREAPHYLHVKYRDWYEADRGRLEDSRQELEKQMLRGKVSALGDDSGETLSSDVSYADASNRLR